MHLSLIYLFTTHKYLRITLLPELTGHTSNLQINCSLTLHVITRYRSSQKKRNRDSHPSLTRATLPDMCGSSGSGLTVTSISLTYFHAESGLILALSCSFVPIGTAWSTGSSLFDRLLILEAGASL